MGGSQAVVWAGSSDDVLRDRWTDVLRQDVLIHLGVMASIAAASVQGYLKDRIPGALPYALADGFFIATVALWFGGMAIRREAFRGPGRSAMLLLIIIAVPTLYLLHPGTPLLIKLAGLRAWVEFPVGCLMALSVIRTTGQVRAYIAFIIGLGVLTGLYGIWQYQAGPGVVLSLGSLAELRHGGSIFYVLPGTTQVRFRAISTFNFPAPFAMMMVFAILLAAGGAVSAARRLPTRVLLVLLIPLLFLAMTVSGTRAALIILAAGLGVIAWYHRLTVGQVALVVVVLLGLYAGSLITSGLSLQRLRTVFMQEGLLWAYLAGPIVVAITALGETLVGHGLGRTGVGVPFAITRGQPPGYFIFSDGDVGRAAVEMGVVGLVLILVIVLGLLPYVWRAVRSLLGTDSEDVGLGIGGLLTATGLGVLIGSPFASAPHGIMWWFLLGAVLKVGMMADEQTGRETRDEERETRNG
ncbi:MAG: hypothetical protein HY560_02490 [Gemmatimonadetes bacterium]|nr:hypothetical protein [Gemmatimonadota bacterium]